LGHQRAHRWNNGTKGGAPLYQLQIRRHDVREHLLAARVRQAPECLEQTAEYGAVVVEHRTVPILKQRRVLDALLDAGDASAGNRATEHPVNRTVTVIGAVIAILAEGATELGQHHDHGVAPSTAERIGIGTQAAAERGQVGRQPTETV
jgi:hypothetical protein